MKIALISDIHGNLQALEAVLENLEREGVDQIVCLGDVAFKGPQPHETISLLRKQHCLFVRGNTDTTLLSPTLETDFSGLTGEGRVVGDCFKWTASNLSSEDFDFIHGFAPSHNLQVGDGQNLLCFHGAPDSAETRIQPGLLDDQLASLLAGHSADYFAGGHVHIQFMRPAGNAVFINPGSVGFSRSSLAKRNAEYAMLDFFPSGYYVKFKQIEFDWAETVRVAKSRAVPHMDWLLSS